MMHLQYEKAENIITNILELWNPKYILLREIKKEGEAVTHPKLYHRYDRFLEKYFIIEDTSSTQDNLYFIWLLKKK
jgi:hypothetical protein